ncbi:glycosyltransferase family 2 protein [Pseudopelagicola sp. nBUS_19]|uniref:glycosyltransferase family 2 protein n=1 Tax=unclassified Pseudopelagicola TaxID=2649563 RepID=UPI003EBE0266
MDQTKSLLAVSTMVYQDYFFLERWYAYYAAQVGAENLYVFSHGNDPEHRRIAKNANVMNLPRDERMHKFDRRRWRALGSYATGLSDFYNWIIVSDVDEIVIVDPQAASSIPKYILQNYSNPQTAPKNISPLCLELIHIPEEEPLPIEDEQTILSRRRIFRPNQNYSKPCLVGGPVVFGPGGHRNTLGRRHMPEDMYTLHLKFFDYGKMSAVAEKRKQTVINAGKLGSSYNETHGWHKTLDYYRDIVAAAKLGNENIRLPRFRAKMQKQVEKYSNQFVWGTARTNRLFRIPERFSDVF